MPKSGHLSPKFSKTNVRFEISTFEIGYMQNFVNIRKLILIDPKYPNLGIWAQSVKNKSWQKILDLPSFEISGLFGSICKFFGLFRLVFGGFGTFLVSFWLVLGPLCSPWVVFACFGLLCSFL